MSSSNKNPAEEGSSDERNSKRVKTSDDGGEPDLKVTPYLEDIESIQDEIIKLNEKASEEILKVEQKFNKLRKPYYEKRNELLKNIPQFWLQTLYNHPNISSMIATEDEEDCLNFLSDLDVEEFEDIKSGYRIKLHFSENPYFNNDVLIKEFHMVAGEYEQEAESTPIDYKNTEKGRSLKQSVENELEALKGISRNQEQNTMKSFFAWFLDPIESGTDEIAELIKDQIWPNPLEFYLAQNQTGSNDSESDDDCSEDFDEEGQILQDSEIPELDDEGEEEDDDDNEDASGDEDDEEFPQDDLEDEEELDE